MNSVTPEPHATRPIIPRDYGVPEQDDGLLPWSWARERLERASLYWFSTVRADGRPHAMPAWALWIDGILYFEGGPDTVRMRNIAARPSVVVQVHDHGDEVVIVEGQGGAGERPSAELARQLAEGFAAKYGESHDYRPPPTQWDNGGLWLVRPTKAFGWSEFPKTVTRWVFDQQTEPEVRSD
jgi:pyridoxamine 5'-phosphate oxidase-like protein